MHFELASLEGFWEVLSKDKRFDRLDHSAAFALLVEFHDAHTSDQLLHFGCNLAPQVVISSSSHKTPPNSPERFSRVLYETYFAATIAGFIQFTSAPSEDLVDRFNRPRANKAAASCTQALPLQSRRILLDNAKR